MRRQRTARDGSPQVTGDDARRRLLAGVPVTERRLVLAGVSTVVQEGGDGPPLVLPCGQGGWTGVWLPAIAELIGTDHVVAPDLPELGASQTPQGPPRRRHGAGLARRAHRSDLHDPAGAGGNVAGRLHRRPVRRRPQRSARPAGAGGRRRPARSGAARAGALLALVRHSARPSERTLIRLSRQVTLNLHELGLPQIPLRTAQQASARYGWPLHVIENAGHFVVAERPTCF